MSLVKVGHPVTTLTLPVEYAEHLAKRNYRPRTVADLWAETIDPTKSRPIRPVLDTHASTWTVDNLDWDTAWSLYTSNRARHSSWNPKTWLDRLRYSLHRKLLKWKVIV